jgi:putative redox protein
LPPEIVTEVVHHGGMRFEGMSRSGRTVELDCARGGETAAGYTPLELLLASLAGCSGQVVVGLLKRMGQEVAGFRVVARGVKKDIHPAVFTSIALEFEFSGGRLEPASVEKALALSEERYCPVWAMLKASVPIKAEFRLLAG